MQTVEIQERRIGPGYPCFVIAEAGVNHNGCIELALRMIDVAQAAGADAVKFQTFNVDKLVTENAPKAPYQIETTGRSQSQAEMLRRLELSKEDHQAILQRCSERDILFLSTPFDADSADFLDSLDMPVFKIPSGEVTNMAFLKHVARKGKPIILSTGMCTLSDVEAAVEAIRGGGSDQLILLHCVSNYPADPKDMNLRAIRSMVEAFSVPCGLSDHTLGIEVALAAVALGACVIEKHFTMDRNLDGPDHRASLNPAELTALVNGIRKVEVSLGTGIKQPVPAEVSSREVIRRSLVAAEDLKEGTVLTQRMIVARRPRTGLDPDKLELLVGRRLKVSVKSGAPFRLDMVEA